MFPVPAQNVISKGKKSHLKLLVAIMNCRVPAIQRKVIEKNGRAPPPPVHYQALWVWYEY